MIRDEETLNILLDSIARFVREVLVPNEALVAETDTIPPAIVAQMRELGLFGLSIPEAYGGLELSMEEEVRVAFEIARTSPAFRSLIGTNNGIGSQGIVIDGTEAQKQYYLPKLAAGEIIGSFALTEAGSGSDAASLRIASDTSSPASQVPPSAKRTSSPAAICVSAASSSSATPALIASA